MSIQFLLVFSLFLSSFQLPQIPKPSGFCPPLAFHLQFAAGDIGDSSSGIAPGTGGISCFDPLGVGTSSLRIELVAETVFTLETAQASCIAVKFLLVQVYWIQVDSTSCPEPKNMCKHVTMSQWYHGNMFFLSNHLLRRLLLLVLQCFAKDASFRRLQ